MFKPRVILASYVWVTNSITCMWLLYEGKKDLPSISSSCKLGKEWVSPLCCTYCCVFLGDAPFILDEAATGSPAKSWFFFSVFPNISGRSKILSCWRPSARTEWTCPRAAVAGRQVSTHRQDIQKQSKHNRAPFLLWEVNNSKGQAPRNQFTHPA